MASWESERAKVWQIIFRHKRRIEELEGQVKFLTSDVSEQDSGQVDFDGTPDGIDDLTQGSV